MQTSKTLHRSRLGWIALLMIAALALGGCATATNPADMLATPKVANKHAQAVAIEATNMLEPAAGAQNSPTSGKGIADSITKSVEQSGLFSKVVTRGDANYLLTAVLITNETPAWGMTFTAKCEMGWTLAKADGTSVWKEVIKSEGTATGNDAFVGMQRALMARQRAIRENITQALTKIGEMKL